MELDLTDEQRMLADAVKSLLDKRYDANARLQLLESDDRLEPRAVEAVRRARAARADLRRAVRRRRHGRRRARGGDGGLRSRARARAVHRDRRARRVSWSPRPALRSRRRSCCPASPSGERCSRSPATEPPHAGRSPTSRRRRPRRRRLAAVRREDRRTRRRRRRPPARDRADARTATSGCSSSPPSDVTRDTYRMQDGLGGADVLLDSAPAQRSAHRPRRSRTSSRCSTSRPPCSARRPSARWTGCSG